MRLVILSFLFLLTACVDKHNVGFFDNDKVEQQALKYSAKKEIYLKDKRYLVVVTYLNPIHYIDIDRKKDNFLINVFTDPKSVDVGSGAKILNLESSSKISKISPIYSKWSKYYLAIKNINDEKILNIKLDGKYEINFRFENE